MKDIVVQLIRRFVPTAAQLGDWEFLSSAASGKPVGWHDLEDFRRVLILADPGAGKTFEALDRAKKIRDRGAKSFFIRIEAINATFETAFEVGTATEFAEWLISNEEAWFFLDSVDEAQLETPRALEDAIRLFGARIHDARERAHIFITSREDAWKALSDRSLVKQYLPFGAPSDEATAETENDVSAPPDLQVFRLAGLKIDQIRLFAGHYGVGNVSAFVAAIERGNLMSMGERPFDLKALIRKWQADQALGGRLEVLQRMIELLLAPLSLESSLPKIDTDKARAGARSLAAAVTLTGRNIICLPDGLLSADRIEPAKVLPDWSEAELAALLRTGIFDDIVYTSVRFRHREIRELLTAEWAAELMSRPEARTDVEALFFRTQYGEEVIVPRMRPTLTWLLLLDETVRDRALALEPEIATEGGDPSHLPLPVRQAMLTEIVERIAADKE
ncbi:hypothetical protein EUU23_10715 [Sphingorhabdus sp. IMCC26285]|uniref:Uncharacterized protein n=1 Tax=Sphingorhabdus profundilacus TaxID=2509718 RepID=A0A6I4M7U4_9SPHN|nr:hypothetical protein [Sphingorhabdus profundilacus]MVZ98165.1 hypothetical protein [Sphingorhabdus profundilacus]